MKIAFFSDTKRIKKVVIGLLLFIAFFPILKDYLINLNNNVYIVLKINRALRESKIDNRFSIFILGHTTHIKTIEDYAPPSGASPMTVSSFVSSLSSNQAGHLKEFCDCLPESEDLHPSIAIQNALLDIPPLIKKDKILKEYVIKKQPYSCTTFVHIIIYDDYHSIYFVNYYIPF